MSIMSRVVRLWKADLHGVMDQLEDKALLLKQCLREMETSLQQKQTHLAHLRKTCEQIREEQTARAGEKEKVEADIALAVRKEKDDIARMLIRKRMVLQADEERMAKQMAHLEEEALRLSRILTEQQGRYERLKIKTAAYCQRAEERAAADADPFWNEPAVSGMATEEEVELELMRCKEAFTQGGGQ